MKRFFVAAFCTLMMSGSLLAQEATIVAPVAPVEDVAAEAIAPVAQPVAAEGTSFTVAPQVEGCTNCGVNSVAPASYVPMTYTQAPVSGCSSCGSVAPVSYAPMTYTQAPVSSGCNGCGSVAPMTYAQAPVSSGCNGCGTPAPVMMSAPVSSGCNTCGSVSDCGCAAPVADCCDSGRSRRQVVRGTVTRVRGRLGSRRGNNCCY